MFNKNNPVAESLEQVGTGRGFYDLRSITQRTAPLLPSRKCAVEGYSHEEVHRLYVRSSKYIKPINGHYYDISWDDFKAAVLKCGLPLYEGASILDLELAFHGIQPAEVVLARTESLKLIMSSTIKAVERLKEEEIASRAEEMEVLEDFERELSQREKALIEREIALKEKSNVNPLVVEAQQLALNYG